MAQTIDISELDDFSKKLMQLATQKMPKASQKFLRQEGSKLAKITKQNARRSGVKKHTGQYIKSIKKGKVYKFDGKLSIRAYSTSPHAHLIEDGHRIVGKNGSNHGFKPGHHVFKRSLLQFRPQFLADCEEFFNDLLDKGLH
ncbi:hypothetical protein D3C75_473760 [compost metagenome]